MAANDVLRFPGREDPHAWLADRRSHPGWRRRAVEQLVQLIAVDTTPRADLTALAAAEQQCFDLIESFVCACSPDLRCERVPITPAIAGHPCYTQPYYARRTGDVAAVARTVYRDRGNLFVILPAPGRRRLVLNAHVDVVAPYIPPAIEGEVVYGRGSADDKGPVVAILLAIAWLCEARERLGGPLPWELIVQFVIDEETGGNGTLSAALDRQRSAADAFIVLECTGLDVHPGNRGVVWYEVRLRGAEGTHPADMPLSAAGDRPSPVATDRTLEAAAWVVGALEECGRQLRAESDHPLFPHRPVQTSHGILGPFGSHPSRVQDRVVLRIACPAEGRAEVRQVVERALAAYCERYGDKTRPGAGEGILERHLCWRDRGEFLTTLEIFGLAGHMGSVDRLDGAITKAAWIVRALVEARRQGEVWSSLAVTLEGGGEEASGGVGDSGPTSSGSEGVAVSSAAVMPSGPLLREHPGAGGAGELVLEGGQGFLPTHSLEEVAERMRRAAGSAVASYCRAEHLSAEAVTCEIGFGKLHNDAYARPADGPVVRALVEAATAAGIAVPEPLRGWDVSCDARILAREYPDSEVITFGPGRLSLAHGNHEHVHIDEILRAAEALARLVLHGPAGR